MITSPCNEHPITPHILYSKTGVYRGILFSYFCLREAVLTCNCNLCFEQK